MKKKCLALFLALCLGCSLLPAPAFAAGNSYNYTETLEHFLGIWGSAPFDSNYPPNVLERMLNPFYCYVDEWYPGEIAKQKIGVQGLDKNNAVPDPLGKYGYYSKVNAQKAEWVLENIFNCSKADIERMKAPILAGEQPERYYWDGYYYYYEEDIGSTTKLSIQKTQQNGKYSYVTFKTLPYYEASENEAEYYYAIVEQKTLSGKKHWSLHYLTSIERGQDPTQTGGFVDVASNAYYCQPVLWAVDQGITYGTGWASFSPDATCTKGQILTFLWRAQGQPKPSGANPFQDVSSGDYFYQAALWAAEKGLVSGPSFQGGAPCTRAMTVSYLWKLAGSPAASGASFGDVPAGTDTAQAVAWAVDEGIAYGTGNGKFSPNATCTRGQIVTFLYRAD